MRTYIIICVDCGASITVEADNYEDAGDRVSMTTNWDASTDTPLCPPCADAFWGAEEEL